jgi:integrase
MKRNFTKRYVESLPAPKEKRSIYYDSTERGLGVMVQPTGHRAFFWARKVQGRLKWRTIGEFPALTIEQAREGAAKWNTKASTWKKDGYEGQSPFKPQQAVQTFGELSDDYIEKRIKGHASHPEKAAKTAEWMVKKYLHEWRNVKATDIDQDAVNKLQRDLVKAKHGIYVANRCVQFVKAVYNWGAKSSSRIKGIPNPAKGIDLFHETKRARFLQPDELPRFFTALNIKEENDDGLLEYVNSADLRDFVPLALWTGARRGDILSMRWQDLSLDDNRWTVPDPKNRTPYAIPLTPEAIEILRNRLRRQEKKQSPWVFPSRGKTGHLTDLKGAWKKFLERAKVADLRIHDLRRTLGSYQAIAGFSLPIIGASLGHKSVEATKIYSRLTLDPVRQSVMTATRAIKRASKKKPKLLAAHVGGGT